MSKIALIREGMVTSTLSYSGDNPSFGFPGFWVEAPEWVEEGHVFNEQSGVFFAPQVTQDNGPPAE